MSTTYFDIGKDFSPHLGPRERKLGDFSGEALFDVIEPMFRQFDLVIVDLDAIDGFSASCLDEAFGGLVRMYGLKAVKARLRLRAISNDFMRQLIETWMEEAEASRKMGGGRERT